VKSGDEPIQFKSLVLIKNDILARRRTGITLDDVRNSINVHLIIKCEKNALKKVNVCKLTIGISRLDIAAVQ
jgi:hypothetical protein